MFGCNKQEIYPYTYIATESGFNSSVDTLKMATTGIVSTDELNPLSYAFAFSIAVIVFVFAFIFLRKPLYIYLLPRKYFRQPLLTIDIPEL